MGFILRSNLIEYKPDPEDLDYIIYKNHLNKDGYINLNDMLKLRGRRISTINDPNSTPPPSPNLQGLVGNNQVTVDFSAIEGDSVVLEKRIIGGSFSVILTTDTENDFYTFVDNDVVNGENYEYRAITISNTQGPSNYSSILSIEMLEFPTVVTNLVAIYDRTNGLIEDENGKTEKVLNKVTGTDFGDLENTDPSTRPLNDDGGIYHDGVTNQRLTADIGSISANPALTVITISKAISGRLWTIGQMEEGVAGNNGKQIGLSYRDTDKAMRFNDGNVVYVDSWDNTIYYNDVIARGAGGDYNSSDFYENGVLKSSISNFNGTNVPNLPTNTSKLVVGVNYDFDSGAVENPYEGYWEIIIIYDKKLTTNELESIFDWVNNKYGIESASQTPSAPTSTMLVSEQELQIWKNRWNNPSTSLLQNEKNRLQNNVDSFMANKSADRWTNYYDGPGSIPIGTSTTIQDYEPKQKIDKLRDTAFVYLLTGNTSYSDLVRTELLAYANNPDLDFSNRTRYPVTSSDSNPLFYYAGGITKMLYAYEYTKDTFSSSEKTIMETFLYNAAEWFQLNVDAQLNSIFTDRNSGVINESAVSIVGTTHTGGFGCPRTGHNNRRGDMVRLYALVGVLQDVSIFKTSAKLFFEEFIRYNLYSDGTPVEHYRGSPGSQHERGWGYSTVTINEMIAVADIFARNGDTSLFDYTSSGGVGPSVGGPKGLLKAMQAQIKYHNGDFNRYWDSDKIDTYIPQQNKTKYDDMWFCQANIYYKDSFITQNIYSRDIPENESLISGHGVYSVWGGDFNTLPSKVIMYYQMEGLVNPYDPDQSQSLSM